MKFLKTCNFEEPLGTLNRSDFSTVRVGLVQFSNTRFCRDNIPLYQFRQPFISMKVDGISVQLCYIVFLVFDAVRVRRFVWQCVSLYFFR